MIHGHAPGAGNGPDGGPSSSAVLDSALDALRGLGGSSPGNDPSISQISSFLVTLLSDAPAETPLLERLHRRALVKAVIDGVGPDAFTQILHHALPNLRLHPSRTTADLLMDIGPNGLVNTEAVRAILARFGFTESSAPSEDAIAEILAGLLSTPGDQLGGLPPTDMTMLVQGITTFSRFVSWARIIHSLDEPEGLVIAHDVRWDSFARAMLAAPQDGHFTAISGLWGAWAHRIRQLQILNGLLSVDPELFTFVMLPGRRVVTVDEVVSANNTVKSQAANVQDSTWNALDLIETMVQVADWDEGDVRQAVAALLEKAVKANADLVLMGLIQVPRPWNAIHNELVTKLLAMFLGGHSSHQLVFYRIWQLNRNFLLNALRNYYQENPRNVARVLDVAQELKVLDAVLDLGPFFFSLEVAALAARRDFLNLEKWLQDNIQRNGNEFIRAALEFLDSKVKDDLSKPDPNAESTSMPLTVQSVALFLRVLRSNGDSMTPEEIDFFKVVRNLCLQLHPRLMNLAPGTEGQEPGLQVVTFPQDVHKETDGYYRQMYEGQISIEDLISLLQRSKVSEDPRDRQIFACMVHTLFDEYRCFEMYYPPKELGMTAVVFGSLIQHQLIDFIPLGIAIRYVLDALRSPPDSNMFQFGLQALLRFEERLPEWPQLGQALMSLPIAQQGHPEIARVVRDAMQGNGATNGNGQQQVNGIVASRGEEPKVPFTAINVDPLHHEMEPSDPDEDTSDKLLFIVNNLSPSNIDAKLGDARKLLKPELYHWFSSYLVLQRISIEPNNHGLYAQFLDGINASSLFRHVLHETYAKVKMLLNSDKTVQSTTERTLLKNLGSWLGGLTVARNKPIRHRNIAFKDLLIQGYDSNRLIVAIPFVCKVLEQCSRSTIFSPPNPWLLAVLRLLVELYQFAELKLNLKFEIEVLCKSLNIDLKDIQSTTILRTRPQELAAAQMQQVQQQQQQQQQQQLQAQQRQLQQQQQQVQAQQQAAAILQGRGGMQQQGGGGALAQDLERLSMGGSGYPGAQGAAASRPQGALLAGSGSAGGLGAATNAAGGGNASAVASMAVAETMNSMLQSLPHYLVFSPQAAIFASNNALKRLVCGAIERAIREIIAPVVERSVTIASVSARELITKDFSMESDENKMRKAAHQMAQSLAGSLALVTCKEPLRLSMFNNAKQLLLSNGFTEQTLPEQALLLVIGDNLELACSVVERVAMAKAIPEIDEGLANAYASRREHRQRGRGYYWDAAALTTSQYAATLPDLLRLKPDGLQPQQMRVYEEFDKIPRASPTTEPAPALVGPNAAGSPSLAHMPDAAVSYGGGAPSAMTVAGAGGEQAHLEGQMLSRQQSLDKFTECISELERLLQQEHQEQHDQTLATLPPNHEIRLVARQVPILAAQSVSRDETALAFSQKVVQLLYKTDSDLGREIFVILLERLCEVSVKVAKEVTAWLVYAEDERKFNVAVTVGLVRAGLINIVEQDVQLAKFVVKEFKPTVVDFASQFALACLGEPACATKSQLSNTIDALTRAAQRGKATDSASQFLSELEGGQLKSKTDIGNSALREQLAYCFAEWVRLFQHSPNAEKSFIDFVTQLQDQGILKGEEISSMFFRVCTEVGVDSYIKQKAAGGSVATGIYVPIDAFSKLVVLMIKYHADPTGTNNEQAKVHYLTKVLSIVVLVLAQSHEELGPHFQQKPFFRFFSSLLHDLHQAEPSLQTTYLQSLLAVGNTLNTLQPSFFPGFTFSWMTLISHRLFMPKLLASGLIGGLWEEGRSEGWAAYHRLFGSLLRFLMPFLRTAELRETSRNLYMGTLRILLVLLHDFPEFLSSFHASLCDLVPTSCIQLRNLILSSYPREQFGVAGLPDAFTPRLKIEELPHGDESPIILSDFTGVIAQQPGDFNAALDAYLAEGGPSSFLSTLQDTVVTQGEYNTPLLNAIVLYSGVKSMEQQGRTSDAGFQVIEELLTSLDPEGRYLTVGAVCNQLRVPSKHTAYYSSMILNLFEQHEEVREAILRVLVERVIVNRPHPWGLLVTMFALLRNEEGRYPLPPNCPLDIVELLQHMREGLPGGNRGASASAEGTYQQQWLQQQEQAQPPHHQFDQHLHHQHHQQQQQSQQQQLSA